VATESHTDIPDRFHQGMRLWALAENGSRRELEVEEFWPHKSYLVLKFVGIESISDAETLLRCELQVPEEQRAQLETGWAYVSDLIGCEVLDGDCQVGVVRDVQFGAGEAPLLLVRSGSREYEIPYAEAYLNGTNLKNKKIRMTLPEGMLELNAPLTPEEKEQQRRNRNS